jgi:hypothetical protein
MSWSLKSAPRILALFGDAHSRNTKLSKLIESFNAELLASANKISAFIQMSHSDSLMLFRCQRELSQVLGRIGHFQDSKIHSDHLIEALTQKRDNLLEKLSLRDRNGAELVVLRQKLANLRSGIESKTPGSRSFCTI